MRKASFLIFLIVNLTGCGTLNLSSSIQQYYAVALGIKLGDSKEEVLSLLMPTQQKLAGWEKKASEFYMDKGDLIEIYYFRTGWQEDGLNTDDEFIPYVFTNGELTSIGWTVLGGPKTIGQVIQPAPVTNIEVNDDDD